MAKYGIVKMSGVTTGRGTVTLDQARRAWIAGWMEKARKRKGYWRKKGAKSGFLFEHKKFKTIRKF